MFFDDLNGTLEMIAEIYITFMKYIYKSNTLTCIDASFMHLSTRKFDLTSVLVSLSPLH